MRSKMELGLGRRGHEGDLRKRWDVERDREKKINKNDVEGI